MNSPRKKSFSFSSFVFGILFTIIVGIIIAVYVFQTMPVTEESKPVIWARQHEQEVTWAMDRYEKFQDAASSAYFENDIKEIRQSK